LRDNGYTAVTVSDLLGYVNDGTPLPEKPVMITFDDGYYNNYLYAFPLLKKYNMKAIISIIGRYTDQYSLEATEDPLYSHITWQEAREMADSGFVELQNHSYNLHTINKERTASMRVSGESVEHYEKVLVSDAVRLQSLMQSYTGQLPTAYTYPFGLVSQESVGILSEAGFQASMSCYMGVNRITRDPQCLFLMKRLLRPHGKSAETLLNHYMK
jgi:peptidoglycan/xylan/chitin deacetylase (PgdA/CDA1 family)